MVNVFFSVINEKTLPILSALRECNLAQIQVWMSRQSLRDLKYCRMLDVTSIDDNVLVDNSLAYYFWDGASGLATPTADPGMRALLTRQRTQSISFVVVGEAPRHKKCLPMFVDAAHHSELPDRFFLFDWVSSSDELCEYCEEKGAFAFSLKDEHRYKKTNFTCKGASIYQSLENGDYLHRDTFHWNHLEVYDMQGVHKGEMSDVGVLDQTKADATKRIHVN